jgi:hypothetical protein
MPRSATADVADLSDPVLKDRVAELKATRDHARVDAVRAQETMDRAGPTISAGSENVCQDRAQAHANRERRLSPRPSPRARPTCRGRSEGSAYYGVDKRAPAHACRSLKRKTAGFGVPVLYQSGAPRSMKMGTTCSRWRYDAAARCALQSANLRRPAILRYASRALFLPISPVALLPFDSGLLDQSRDRRNGPNSDLGSCLS